MTSGSFASSYVETVRLLDPPSHNFRTLSVRNPRNSVAKYPLFLRNTLTPAPRNNVARYNMLMLAQFRCEGRQPLAPGKHTVVFDFKYDGPGVAKGGAGVLKVDGADVATLQLPHTIPFGLPIGETFDVGIDTRTPVNEKDYQVPFRFNGKLNQLTFRLGPVRFSELEQKRILEAIAIAND
jgi:hypothetical protein